MFELYFEVSALATRSEYNNYVQAADFRILNALSFLCGKFGKLYSFPSQDSLCEYLTAPGGKPMTRRTLNRHLNTLERQGFIKRQRRHTRQATRGWCFKSTLYTLTRRALRYLGGLAVASKKAVEWAGALLRKSRVPNLAQHSLPKGNHTGGRRTTAAPPNNKSDARDARTETATSKPTNIDAAGDNGSTGYNAFRAMADALRRGRT